MKHPVDESEICRSPILTRAYVLFRGKHMTYSKARRLMEYREPIRRLADKGIPAAVIAKKMKRSFSCIQKWTNILGITIRKERKRDAYKHDQSTWGKAIKDGCNAGLTQGGVAKTLGVNHVNVHRWCERNKFDWMKNKHYAQQNVQTHP